MSEGVKALAEVAGPKASSDTSASRLAQQQLEALRTQIDEALKGQGP